MRILIAGGSGTIGRMAVTRAVARGHNVVVMSRNPGDGRTGPDGVMRLQGDVTEQADVEVAIKDVEAVLDCTNLTTISRRKAEAFFVAGTRTLVRAGAGAGVSHHVLLSIVGVDAFPFAYHQAKLAQETALIKTAAETGVSYTIARTTQFHDFAEQVLARTRMGPLAFVPPLRIQPVDLGEVAEHLLSTVEGAPADRAPDLAGPRPERLTGMVRAVAAQRGLRLRVVPLPLPPAAARANRAAVLVPRDGIRAQIPFADWLRGIES